MLDQWLVIGAFFAIYVIWGSTYLVNYFAMATIPPFVMLGTRFFVAGALLFAWGWWRGQPWPSTREWGNSFLIGNLFLAIGTGGVVWALQWIDTGMAALIVAFDPLIIMALLWLIFGSRPHPRSLVGAAISIVGMALLVGQPRIARSREALWGLLAIAVALISWAVASIYVSRMVLPESRLRRSALQMITGGAGLLLFSALTGELATFAPAAVSLSSFLAWTYLVVMGSWVAFSSFNYLLAKVAPEKVATSTYVNPVVAMLLGWLFNNEVITGQSALAALLLLTGVFFINRKEG
ncbi:MAG: EamA family transporter [Lewinella sp.]|nr:EamA family transporter [Lewinella sp.]